MTEYCLLRGYPTPSYTLSLQTLRKVEIYFVESLYFVVHIFFESFSPSGCLHRHLPLVGQEDLLDFLSLVILQAGSFVLGIGY